MHPLFFFFNIFFWRNSRTLLAVRFLATFLVLKCSKRKIKSHEYRIDLPVCKFDDLALSHQLSPRLNTHDSRFTNEMADYLKSETYTILIQNLKQWASPWIIFVKTTLDSYDVGKSQKLWTSTFENCTNFIYSCALFVKKIVTLIGISVGGGFIFSLLFPLAFYLTLTAIGFTGGGICLFSTLLLKGHRIIQIQN